MSESRQTDLGEYTYQMTLSLNVLEHLGINLYSSVPPVLSEAVANAWDADANEVDIEIDEEEMEIAIIDDGLGMDENAVNGRYLHVGYQRRENQGEKTPSGRDVMGRKGIGKLSLFSIAKTVEVYTTDGTDTNAFRMNVEAIRDQIGGDDDDEDEVSRDAYYPEELDEFPDDLDGSGTKIVLKNLKKEHIYNTEEALRKRLARRFSVIGESHDFVVRVNGQPIEITDRDYFHKLQFLWTLDDGEWYGEESKAYEDYCPNLDEDPIQLNNETESGYEIEGWIGAVEKPKQLEVSYGGEKDDLNKITLLVRGKMAKEDLLDDFNDSGHYTHYLVGELQANFLDLNDRDDISTTNREDIVQIDERYQELLDLLYDVLNEIRSDWDELRNQQGSKKARQIPAVDDWYQRLDSTKQQKARQLFGKMNKITTDSEEERRELFQYGILAFERLRYKENLERIDELDPEDVESVNEVFVDLDDLEASLYYQIVKQRIEVIKELKRSIDEERQERVLQDHIFDHLWLLEPSWERATESHYKEQSITSEFEDELPDSLTDEEVRGRVDIKYRLETGRHVIVELKRPGRSIETPDLMSQGNRYRRTLKKILRDRGRGDERVEVAFVLGGEPSDWDDDTEREEWEDSLEEKNMRVLSYRTLLDNAEEAYGSYLEREREVGEIAEVIERIETGSLSD